MCSSDLLGDTGPLIPAAFKPIIESAADHSFYTGQSITGARNAGVEAEYQYGENTPEMLKQLGMALHMSPAKIEHVVRGYTGGLGIGLMSLLNPLLISPLDEHGPVAKRVSELPFIGTLFQPNDASGVVNDAYESVDRKSTRLNSSH